MQAYSPVDTEPVWAALFALLKANLSATYQTMSRHHVMPPTLMAEMQPALFLVDVRDSKSHGPPGLPGKATLSGFIILYFQAPAPLIEDIGAETLVGSTVLNGLLLGVRQALQPDNVLTGKLSLGGLVEHCWIEGDTEKDPGMFTQQGAAIVPIRILVP